MLSPLAMFGLGVPELLIILAVVLLLFGGSRLAGLGKSTGRALKEFKEETKGLKPEDKQSSVGPGSSPYQTEGGSTFVQTPQGSTPYGQPPQGGSPQGPAQPGSPYVQPPQSGATPPAPPQNGVPYAQPPQSGSTPYEDTQGGAPYGWTPSEGPDRDTRRDV